MNFIVGNVKFRVVSFNGNAIIVYIVGNGYFPIVTDLRNKRNGSFLFNGRLGLIAKAKQNAKIKPIVCFINFLLFINPLLMRF